jgi:hypothetical protein
MFLATLEDLKKYVIVSNQFTMPNIEVVKKDIISVYFEKWIPKSLITAIEGYKADANAIKQESFVLFENALAKLCINQYLVSGQISISDGAITRTESEHEKTAYKNQINENRDQYLDNGLNAIEDLFNLMDANTSLFAGWSTSVMKVRSQKLLIQSATEFDLIEMLFRKNATYFQLLSSQETCIDLYLRARFSTTLIDEIVANASLIPEKKQFRIYLQKALANFTLMSAIKDKIGTLTPSGFKIFEQDKDTASTLETSASNEAFSAAIRAREDVAKRYMNLANSYMYSNKSAFGLTDDETPLTKTANWM